MHWKNIFQRHLSQGMIGLKGPGPQLAGNLKPDPRLHTDEKSFYYVENDKQEKEQKREDLIWSKSYNLVNMEKKKDRYKY